MKSNSYQSIGARLKTNNFYSVEFSPRDLFYSYRFRIHDISVNSIEIIIKGDSDLIDHLKKGDILDVRCYPQNLSVNPLLLKCEVIKISKEETGRFKGHCRVTFCILKACNLSSP